MAVFPPSLVILRDGYNEKPPNNRVRSRMDKGPDKVRRNTTSNPRPCTFSVFGDLVAARVLYDFFRDDCSDGTLEFDFTSILTGETTKARFVEEPDFAAQETMWRIGVSLELLA